MPLSKTIKVAGHEIKVRELTVAQIRELANAEADPADTICNLLTACTSADEELVTSTAPSDLGELVAAMLEVNAPFLEQARALGMEAAVGPFERQVRAILILPFLRSSGPATEPGSGTTPGPSSSPH